MALERGVLKKASDVELVLLDVDGVLTDGSIVIDSEGRELKFFNVRDGHAIKLLQRAGIPVGFISGRFSEATLRRAKDLSVDKVYVGAKDKLSVFHDLLEELGTSEKKVCYIGDDLVDIPVMRRVGFPVAVGDAMDEVKKVAVYVTSLPGGKGAVREVAEIILKSKGLWEELTRRYYL